MRIALIVYQDLTLLDLVGVYDPLYRLKSLGILPDLVIDCCTQQESPTDNFGFPLRVDYSPVTLSHYDVLFLPGGFGSRQLQYDKEFIRWLKTAANVPLKASVCTGSLLLGAAGFLNGHRATTHFNEYVALQQWTEMVIEGEELVDDGSIVTAGAVAASLDLGLHLCERLAGKEARERVRLSMNHRE